MTHDERVRKALDKLRSPGPSPDLRERTLDAARRELLESDESSDESKDPWARAWNSRPLRLAWSTALTAVLAAHLALTLMPMTPSRSPAVLLARALASHPELTAVIRLEPSDGWRVPSFTGTARSVTRNGG